MNGPVDKAVYRIAGRDIPADPRRQTQRERLIVRTAQAAFHKTMDYLQDPHTLDTATTLAGLDDSRDDPGACQTARCAATEKM